MQAPASLSPEARESFTHAVAAIEAIGDRPEDYSDAIQRYSLDNATAAMVRSVWEDAGSPATAVGSWDQIIAHPLLAEIRYTEASVTGFGGGVRHPGGAGSVRQGRPSRARPQGDVAGDADCPYRPDTRR